MIVAAETPRRRRSPSSSVACSSVRTTVMRFIPSSSHTMGLAVGSLPTDPADRGRGRLRVATERERSGRWIETGKLVRSSWRPALTRTESAAWGAGSAYQAAVYHVTTVAAASAIRCEGFDLSRRAGGRAWGNGVYATPDPTALERYRRLL